jgi:(p)ppGpp synthase/HD superfamily hydrolase
MSTKIIVPEVEILTPEQLAQREANMATFKKATAALRYRLLGLAKHDKEWYRALKALEFNLAYHPGWRKDKVTPAAMHQITIANQCLTFISDLIDPIRTVIAALSHDTPEDTHVSHAEIRDNFGSESEEDVELLTKKYRGVSKDTDEYHFGWSDNFVTSVVKPIDRDDNISSMGGVFGLEKQIHYCGETVKYFVGSAPDGVARGLKHSRRKFPQQETIYENMKLSLVRGMRPYQRNNALGIAL